MVLITGSLYLAGEVLNLTKYFVQSKILNLI